MPGRRPWPRRLFVHPCGDAALTIPAMAGHINPRVGVTPPFTKRDSVGLNRESQTARLLRAMDHRSFNILGHATGRLLLKRPGYEIDMERAIEQARQNGCFFEINYSPDRLDLSAENARLAKEAGVMIAVSTDAHSRREFGLIRYGLDQARRAGLLEKRSVLNCQPLERLERLFER